MTSVIVLVGIIFGLMLAEARLSRSNERRLRAEGAAEPQGDVYRALAVTYPAAFLAMAVEGLWRAAHQPPAGAVQPGPSWVASGALLFAASKVLKYWAIRSLGERWSFRVMVLPGRPLVTTGPYRYISHPNYVAVVGELLGAAMMMRATLSGPIAMAVFGMVLSLRIRFESRVLAEAGRMAQHR